MKWQMTMKNRTYFTCLNLSPVPLKEDLEFYQREVAIHLNVKYFDFINFTQHEIWWNQFQWYDNIYVFVNYTIT